jgi:hypothetical protein
MGQCRRVLLSNRHVWRYRLRMGVLSFDSRCTISGTNVIVNTWHISVSGQPLNSEATALVAAVGAFYNSYTTSRVGSHITGSRVLYFLESWWTKPTFDGNHNQLTKGRFNTDPFIVPATPHTSAAGGGGTSIPPQLASVLSWRTATSGRSGRGRTYIGGLSTGAQSNNVINATTVSAINAGAAALITAVHAITASGVAADLGVWSPTQGVIRPILSGSSDATFDTMRSRVK